MDKAYAFGISGGNGWQRLFEGTRLQYVFDRQPEKEGYGILMEDSDARSSEGLDEQENERREEDLEAAWVDDLGATWNVKDPDVNRR